MRGRQSGRPWKTTMNFWPTTSGQSEQRAHSIPGTCWYHWDRRPKDAKDYREKAFSTEDAKV